MARHGENIYKRKDNRWEGRYKNGFKEDGTAKYSSVYGKSYAEVKAVLSEKKNITVRECAVCRMTVKKIFTIWLADIKLTVKDSSYQNYLFKVKKHIIPVFGDIGYEKLTVNLLNEFTSNLVSKGLSVKYIRDILNVIRSVFRYAKKKFGYADKSDLLTMPKDDKKGEKTLLNEEQQKQLKNYLSENYTYSNIGMLLTFSTGLRVGELCALKWKNIDLEKRIITVSHTAQRINCQGEEKATKIVISAPKTFKSARKIPIPEYIVPFLERIKADNDCYLLSRSHKVIEPRRMQYRFKAVLKKLKLPYVSFHALRHMFATNCVKLGFDVKTLSEILGHSTVETTLNRYVHSSMERKFECMKLLSDSMK